MFAILCRVALGDQRIGVPPVLDHELTHRVPHWVKGAAIIFIVLTLMVGSMHLIGERFLGHAISEHGSHAPPAVGLQRP